VVPHYVGRVTARVNISLRAAEYVWNRGIVRAIDPICAGRSFKLASTVPVKMSLGCSGVPVTTGAHTIQLQKVSNTTDATIAIDATPTDAATAGNTFRLDDAASSRWHFNLATTSLSKGVWQIRVTLADGSLHTAYIELK